MLSYCTNYLATMPEITVYMNCDTRLAVNLRMFDLGDNDEFIFAIKNYSYIESPYVFLFRARKTDIDENGEVLFKISPTDSKKIKPGAFYNFSVLLDAFDPRKDTEYKKLTENGAIRVEYGAQDLYVKPDEDEVDCEIDSVRLERIDDGAPEANPNAFISQIIGMRLESLDEE